MSRIGSAAVRALFLRTVPVCPFNLRSWRSLLSRWANPFAQPDCAELLAHVAECLHSTLLDVGTLGFLRMVMLGVWIRVLTPAP